MEFYYYYYKVSPNNFFFPQDYSVVLGDNSVLSFSNYQWFVSW